MKYIIAVLAIISIGGFGLYTYLNQSNGVGGGLGTIEQLSQWRNDGTYITQNTIGTILKLTGYESSGDCLVTNASGVVSTSSCGGGGSSKWTDGGSVIYPAGGESVAVSSISATGTATSTFTRLSVSTALNLFGTIGTALSDFCVAITGGSGLCDGNDATGGGGGSISTSTTPVAGQLAFWTSNSALSSVATGTLTESVSGLQFDQTRGLVGGSAVLSLTSGFAIPSTTDYTGWNLASSSRHSAVTLSGVLDYITLVGQDIVRGAIDLATDITGFLGITNGGTGTSTAPTTDQILVGNSGGAYDYRRITAGTNVTVSTSTAGQIQISSTGGSGTSHATSSWTVCALSTCDFVTDGVADEVQINQAISRASSTGGVIQIFAGEYAIASPILLSGLATEGDGNPEITLIGMGRESTNLNGASNVNVIEIRNRAKYDIRKMSINISGSGTGIKGFAGTERGNWQSNIEDIYIVGDFSTMASTSWGIDLQSPFRMRLANIEMNGVANGANLSAHTDSFNPGNLSVDRMFIDLWDNSANASATAFKLALATTSSTGVNNLVSVNRLDIAGGSNLTNSIGVHILGSISSYGDSRHHTFTNMNIEDVKIAYKLQRARDNTFLDLNYTRVLNGGKIIELDSNSHNNKFENLYAVAQGSGQTFDLITDANGSSNLPNFLTRVDGFQPSTVNINATLAANTILEHIDLSGGSPTIDTDITNRNNNRTFAGLTVTGTTTLATTTATRFGITTLISCDSLDTDSNGYIICGTDATGGGGGGGLGTTSPWTNGNLAVVNGLGLLTSVGTGTLTTTATGLSISNNPAIIGSNTVLSLDAGRVIPLSASTTEWATAYASTTVLTNTFIRNLFSNTVTGLTYTAGTGVTSITGGYIIPLSASTTEWSGFYNTPSSRITANDGLTWSGNNLNFDGGNTPAGELGGTWASPTIDDSLAVTSWNLTTPTLTSFFGTPCTGNTFLQDISDTGAFTCVEATGGGGGGGALSTTTDVIGSPATPELVSYVTGDVMFGGSASTSAEFQFDDDGGQFIISSSSANATGTIESNNLTQALRIGDDIGSGLEYIFSTVGDAIIKGYGAVTEMIVAIAETLFQGNVRITGKLFVASTTYNGATTTDAVVIDGFTNSGEWIQEFCTTPTGETTAVVADTLRGCGRYAYSEDGAGQLDFVVPTTGTSTYFNLQPGATGAANAAGDGMGINWASGLDFGDIQRHVPAMEFAIRQDTVNNATGTFVVAGITDKIGVSADFATEPGQGFYVLATSTQANFLLACNPASGATTYVNTGIASSTTATANANPFVHFRLEVGGTANTAVTAILKARTTTNRNMTEVGSCTQNNSASTQAVAPTAGIGKSGAGTSSDLHLMFLKFWYKQPVF